MTSLYNLRHDGNQYRVTKFDTDLNVESSYLMTATECTCPAGSRPTCRHRQMFRDLLPRIGSHWMFDFDQGQWVATDLSESAKDEDVIGYEIENASAEGRATGETVPTHDPDHGSPTHIHNPHPQWRRV